MLKRNTPTHMHGPGNTRLFFKLCSANDAKCRQNNNQQALYIIFALAVVRPLDLIQEELRLKTKTKPKAGY